MPKGTKCRQENKVPDNMDNDRIETLTFWRAMDESV